MAHNVGWVQLKLPLSIERLKLVDDGHVESRVPRYKLTIEYDGTAYNGFQAQDGQPTVQGALEAAIHAFSGERIRIAAAGRTDTGVHATAQVIHADLERDWPVDTVLNAINDALTR